MKQNVTIAIVFCLALSLFVGWNHYNKTVSSKGSVRISNIVYEATE